MDSSITTSSRTLSAGDDVTIVSSRAVIYIDGSDEAIIYEASGASRRHPDDHPDNEIAICLAASRSLKALGRRIARDAQDRVRAQARASEKQREASEKAAKIKAERAKEIRSKIAKKSKKKKAKSQKKALKRLRHLPEIV